ncbi:60S ribosomal protein L27 [Galdieria sulphuraria]|uniref:60S ribosomal protein L27 n=1 Tax=Galdieria sulphuraria TaxID=130081 RepID=M2XFH0_GALSU|nr:60S ribosomal protein L27e [Galdieria sulphuraria]EME28757.1 60S ribosomal protein L27e [Galdieria sulphuraria]GJD07102.1 60S ribosomal protein L27 [Galdieria sulphuraria]|eukprot:XP_005705277.1 60S ribosomal protein L27e [Galdieria sulphuraria]
MVKFLKPGKVVVVLRGKYAGRKAVIVQNYDNGTQERPYGHCIIAGIEKYPAKVTRKMSEKKIKKRSKVRAFVRVINYNHIMPTRYTLDIVDSLKKAIPEDARTNLTSRKKGKKAIQQLLKERYLTGKNRWFFTKLRF